MPKVAKIFSEIVDLGKNLQWRSENE